MPATSIPASFLTAGFRLRRDQLAKFRTNAGLTNRELAERLGVHESTVSRLMSGGITQPSPRLAMRLLEAFAIEDAEELFEVQQ